MIFRILAIKIVRTVLLVISNIGKICKLKFCFGLSIEKEEGVGGRKGEKRDGEREKEGGKEEEGGRRSGKGAGRKDRKTEGRKKKKGRGACIFVILFKTSPGTVRMYPQSPSLWDVFVHFDTPWPNTPTSFKLITESRGSLGSPVRIYENVYSCHISHLRGHTPALITGPLRDNKI